MVCMYAENTRFNSSKTLTQGIKYRIIINIENLIMRGK